MPSAFTRLARLEIAQAQVLDRSQSPSPTAKESEEHGVSSLMSQPEAKLRGTPDDHVVHWPSVHELVKVIDTKHNGKNISAKICQDRLAADRGRAVDGGDPGKIIYEKVESDDEDCINELESSSDEDEDPYKSPRRAPGDEAISNRWGRKVQGKRSQNFKNEVQSATAETQRKDHKARPKTSNNSPRHESAGHVPPNGDLLGAVAGETGEKDIDEPLDFFVQGLKAAYDAKQALPTKGSLNDGDKIMVDGRWLHIAGSAKANGECSRGNPLSKESPNIDLKTKNLDNNVKRDIYGSTTQTISLFTPIEELNVLPTAEPEYLEVEMTLDTGATVHAMDIIDLPGFTVLESPGSKAGQKFQAAGGKLIDNEGQVLLHMLAPGMTAELVCNVQIAKVTRPLLSVTKMTESGKVTVVCDKDKALVLDEKKQTVAVFEKSGGLYTAMMRIRNPRFQPFGRPAR